jgi:hypothetical protein
MDTIVNPFKQVSLGLVKGVSSLPSNVAKGVSKLSDGLVSVSDSVVENAGKIFRSNPTNVTGRSNIDLTRDMHAFSMSEENQAEVTNNVRTTSIFNETCLERQEHTVARSSGDYGRSVRSQTEEHVVSFAIRFHLEAFSSCIHGRFGQSVGQRSVDDIDIFHAVTFLSISRIGMFVQHWTSAPKIAKEIARLR